MAFMKIMIYCVFASVLFNSVVRVDGGETLDTFLNVFSGQYDNEDQMVCTGGLTSAGLATVRSNFVFELVEVPALGEDPEQAVFYVEQFSANDPSAIYRRRLYHFTDHNNGTLTNTIYKFNDEFRYRNVLSYPALLLSMTIDEVTLISGCDVIWNRNDTFTFFGQPLDNMCFTSDGEERVVEYVTSDRNYIHVDYRFMNATTDEISLHLDLNLSKIFPHPVLNTSAAIMAALEGGGQLYATFDPETNCAFTLVNRESVNGEVTHWRVYAHVGRFGMFEFILTSGVGDNLVTYIIGVNEYSDVYAYQVQPGSSVGQKCILYSQGGFISPLLTIRQAETGDNTAVGNYATMMAYLDSGYELIYYVENGDCFKNSGPGLSTPTLAGGIVTEYSTDINDRIVFEANFLAIEAAETVVSVTHTFTAEHYASDLFVSIVDDTDTSGLTCGIDGSSNSDGPAHIYLRDSTKQLHCDNY